MHCKPDFSFAAAFVAAVLVLCGVFDLLQYRAGRTTISQVVWAVCDGFPLLRYLGFAGAGLLAWHLFGRCPSPR